MDRSKPTSRSTRPASDNASGASSTSAEMSSARGRLVANSAATASGDSSTSTSERGGGWPNMCSSLSTVSGAVYPYFIRRFERTVLRQGKQSTQQTPSVAAVLKASEASRQPGKVSRASNRSPPSLPFQKVTEATLTAAARQKRRLP